MYKPEEAKLFGAAIKQFLTEKKLSQRQFAKQAGFADASYVSKLVNPKAGKEIAEPRKEIRQQLAKGLGITEQELLEYVERYRNSYVEKATAYIDNLSDLMSLAISMLKQLKFDEKFKKNITSSYTGYRLMNPGARAKKYLLVLAQRKEGLCISVSKDVLEPHILCLKYYEDEAPDIILGKFWIIPSKEDIFLASMQIHYPNLLDGEVTGAFTLNEFAFRFYHNSDFDNSIDFIDDSIDFIESPEEFDVNSLGSHNCYLVINEDKLFPYTLQVCITSREILEEFIRYFGEILMEHY